MIGTKQIVSEHMKEDLIDGVQKMKRSVKDRKEWRKTLVTGRESEDEEGSNKTERNERTP